VLYGGKILLCYDLLRYKKRNFYREYQLSDINFKGVFFTVQKALPHLNDGASIVLTSSVVGQMGNAADFGLQRHESGGALAGAHGALSGQRRLIVRGRHRSGG